MKKTKYPSATKASSAVEEPDEELADRLLALANSLRESDAYAVLGEAERKTQADLRKVVRKCLLQQREQVLADALDYSYEEDAKAHHVLRENIEDLAGTALLHRDDKAALEVNAFVIPLFIHTTGGLNSEQCFQDEDAFNRLRESIIDSGLESRKASVMLVSHAYHPDEIRHIAYCQLNAMVHEATGAMTRKKLVAADAIVGSMRGWPPSHFAPDDHALELRFLLGFALKAMDDAFYHVPEKEAAADRYFDERAERFRQWSKQATPLLRRCLVTDGRDMQIDFLYQDLFFGGKDAALAEMEVLRLLSEVQGTLELHETGPDEARAIIGPMVLNDESVLRISLHARSTGTLIGNVDGPANQAETMESAIADRADGLIAIGVREVQIARAFDSEGLPTGVRAYSPR
ncbi:DUF2863 family protein [Noviherbaspirillum saxi]|uniref:DUF2863 family protein n=1 Tax=Noviherbaspirillum saxi TaxID=2320863 RepID=A0A3A3G304_9BURK|nr:DUF2863 family protein [Noviherbaspirillum saxi]RJF95796.1 DUF2863 family protein [Noviherbaspirillum saxi]